MSTQLTNGSWGAAIPAKGTFIAESRRSCPESSRRLLVCGGRPRPVGVRVYRRVFLWSLGRAGQLAAVEQNHDPWVHPGPSHGQSGGRHPSQFGRHHPAERSDPAHSANPPPRTGLSSLERAHLLRDRFRYQPCRSLYDVVPWNRRRPFATPRPEPRRSPDHALRRHGAALCISS